jgi:hypothetical protein
MGPPGTDPFGGNEPPKGIDMVFRPLWTSRLAVFAALLLASFGGRGWKW